MTLEILIREFIQSKRQIPRHANDLLDYIQKQYLLGKLSIIQYRKLLRELSLRGAEKP